MNRLLSHIRVLDFGHYLAGPLVGMMLADPGAEVIRIDPPGGPRWRDAGFDMLSRGKRALTLDLKSDEGHQTALDLVARSDVVIDNFRPGVMDRLGLGPQHLRKANPNIVSLSLPGFASTDPEHSSIPAWEAVIAARTGQFTDMGLNRRLMGINPSFTPLGLASALFEGWSTIASRSKITRSATNPRGTCSTTTHPRCVLAVLGLQDLLAELPDFDAYLDRADWPDDWALRATFRAIRHDRHPMGRWVDLVAPNAVRPARARITIPCYAPKYGADTRTILTRLGYDTATIDAMLSQGAAGASWSDNYLPE